MRNSCLLLMLIAPGLFAGDLIVSGGSSIYENKNEKNSGLGFIVTGYESGRYGVLIDKRDEESFLSARYSDEKVFLAAGYRYTPFSTFYFLKAKNMYSAFRNPKTGMIPQPINESLFFGLFPGKVSPGIFYSKNLQGKSPAYYIDIDRKISGVYLPQTREGMLFLQLNERINSSWHLSVHSEILAKKRAEAGYMTGELFFPRQETSLFVYSEGGNLNRLAFIQEDNTNDFYIYSEINKGRYSRLEALKVENDTQRTIVTGARVPVIFFHTGAFVLGGRMYTEEKSDTNHGAGFYYEIWQKNGFLAAGIEKRNTLNVYELRVGFKSEGWKFEAGLYALSKDGYLIYYTRDNSEYRKTGLSRYKTRIDFRCSGPFFALALSDTRQSNTDQNNLYASLQFMAKF